MRGLRSVVALVLCAVVVAACSDPGAQVVVSPDGGGGRVATGGPVVVGPVSGGTQDAGSPSGSRSPAVPSWVGTVLSPAGRRAQSAQISAEPGCPQLGPGWVAAENARPGGAPRIGADAGTESVLGYLDRSSATCGQRVGLHLGGLPGSRPRTVSVAAYRMGWYGGAGARVVWRSAPVTVGPAGIPSGVAAPHLVVPAWPLSLDVTIGPDWLPGFYLLVPQSASGSAPVGPAVPLVIRDPSGSEPVELVASTLTWNAYDDWGGWSLYRGPLGHGVTAPEAVADRARVVAVHRPLTGAGYSQLTFMDLPVVRELERTAVERHLDVGYTTDLDADADPGRLAGHAELVFGGHSEYWTTRMYDGLLAAQAAGVNVVFLGANNLWWRARLEGVSANGDPEREVVYRVAAQDPDRSEPTIQWQDVRPPRDPAAVLGESHAGIGVRGGLQVLDAPAWFLAGSGLTPGGVLAGAVGNEADGYNPRARNPVHTQVFADGLLTGAHGPVLTTVSYSTTLSGSATFVAGTTDWACDSTGVCADQTVSPATARAVAVLTGNVVAALSGPDAGRDHPVADTRLPDAADLLRLRPREAIGTYGGAPTDETPRLRG